MKPEGMQEEKEVNIFSNDDVIIIQIFLVLERIFWNWVEHFE
jgi:hypothetical protein